MDKCSKLNTFLLRVWKICN